MEGRIQVRNYENNEGRRVYVTEVVADNVRFLESRGEGGAGPRSESFGQPGGDVFDDFDSSDPFSYDGKPIDISE